MRIKLWRFEEGGGGEEEEFGTVSTEVAEMSSEGERSVEEDGTDGTARKEAGK